MGNSLNKERDEKIFNALFAIAADEALKEEMDALPSCEELNKMYPRTKSLDKKVYAVINKEIRTAKRKKAVRAFANIAAGFLIVAAIGIGAVMSVEASRNFILNWLIDVRGDYVLFDFGIEGSPPESDSTIVLGYKPFGFELASSIAMENMAIYIFEDGTGHNIYIQLLTGSNTVVGVDYEYLDFSLIQLGDGTAYLFVSSDGDCSNIIMWAVGDGVVTITTSLDSYTLVKIAENLVF